MLGKVSTNVCMVLLALPALGSFVQIIDPNWRDPSPRRMHLPPQASPLAPNPKPPPPVIPFSKNHSQYFYSLAGYESGALSHQDIVLFAKRIATDLSALSAIGKHVIRVDITGFADNIPVALIVTTLAPTECIAGLPSHIGNEELALIRARMVAHFVRLQMPRSGSDSFLLKMSGIAESQISHRGPSFRKVKVQIDYSG